MENHLRLAERQGLLSQPSLSEVQHLALRLLIYADNKRAQDAEVHDVKVAMVASGKRTAEEMWPQWFGKNAEEVEVIDEENPTEELPDNANYDAVEWLSPKDGENFAELAKLQEMLFDNSVTVSGGATEDEEGWQ